MRIEQVKDFRVVSRNIKESLHRASEGIDAFKQVKILAFDE